VTEAKHPSIALIVAMARNGVIGRDGGLPWRLSSDLKLFRKLTMGKPLIMGRKTFVSLGKPLDGRDNIVVTRNARFSAEGVLVAHSLREALALGGDCARNRGADELFVIGGADIFREALALAERIYLTRIDADVPGDVTFPPIVWQAWRIVSDEQHEKGARDDFGYRFSVLERINGPSSAV
jgi:dihydrofolate reductase